MSHSYALKRQIEGALPTVVAMMPSEHEHGFIANSLRGLAHVAFSRSLEDAERAIHERTPLMVLARCRDGDDGAVREFAVRQHLAHPDLPIVVVRPASATPADALRIRDWAGVADVLHDNDGHFRMRVSTLITEAHHRVRRLDIAAYLARGVATPSREVVRSAIAHGNRPRSVRELAASIGVPRKTMDRRLSKSLALTARQLVGWGRLIAVAMRLEAPAATVEAAAHELGFASPSALRNLLSRYTGLTPTELRNGGGVEYLVKQLAQALEIT